MTLINAFKNPDAPSPRSYAGPDVTVTIGGQPVTGWTSGWMTSEGRPADFPRVELVPHHQGADAADAAVAAIIREHEARLHHRIDLIERGLEDARDGLATAGLAAASLARHGAGAGLAAWTPEQVEALARVSDLGTEIVAVLAALRERF